MATPNYYNIDPVYDKLFCKCDGATTTFVDTSTGVVANRKAITANGNATQLPIKFNKSAGFFNGTTDYVVVPDSADWDFGTGDFDVEFSVNFTASPANVQYILSRGNDVFSIARDNDNKLLVYLMGSQVLNGAWTPTLNTWYHIRVRRTGGSVKSYIDNTENDTAADSTNIAGTTDIHIGKNQAAANGYAPCWMKELRVVNGASSGAVAVPTVQYTTASEANTKLLLHFDTPATSPLGPAIAFDGTGDYLTLDASADWAFGAAGSGDFQIESFMMFPVLTNATTYPLCGVGNDQTTGWSFSLYYETGVTNTKLNLVNAGTVSGTGNIFQPVINKMYHFAFSRSGATISVFVDGRLLASTFTDGAFTNSSDVLYVGARNYGSINVMSGYMREVRIKKGGTVYTTSFTPSQTGFTVDSNTKLYIKGDENNGVTTFIDSETTPKTVTTAGDCKIRYVSDYRECIFKDETGKFPYPVGSAKVDFFAIGSGAYWGNTAGTGSISALDSDDWDMSAGIFTMEAYIRSENLATAINTILCQKTDANANWRFRIETDGSLTMNCVAGGVDVVTVDSVTAGEILINTWYHVAVSENGDTWKIFINGTDVTRSGGTDTSRLANLTGVLSVGKDTVLDTYFQGRMDNIRISKGVARYTASFNPPEFRRFIPQAILI